MGPPPPARHPELWQAELWAPHGRAESKGDCSAPYPGHSPDVLPREPGRGPEKCLSLVFTTCHLFRTALQLGLTLGPGLRTRSQTHSSHRKIRTQDQAVSLLALQKLMLTHLRVCREPGVSGQSGFRPLPRSRRPRSPLEWQQYGLELPKGCTNRRSSFQNIVGDARSPSGSGPASLLFPFLRLPAVMWRPPPAPAPLPPRTQPGLTTTSPNSEGHRGPGSPALPGKGCERQP